MRIDAPLRKIFLCLVRGVHDCRGTFYVLYEVREDLGEGAFGKVVKVRRRCDGRMFVAKIMHDRGMSDKARQEARHMMLYRSQQCVLPLFSAPATICTYLQMMSRFNLPIAITLTPYILKGTCNTLPS